MSAVSGTDWKWAALQITKRLWFRATLISLLAVAASVVSFAISPYLPEELPATIGADAVDSILGIIASSMLAVTTFSLSATVAAYSVASSSVTPRATKLLIEDTTTQNMLATFVGSFLYSLIAIILLAIGAYGERGRVVLFGVTILVVMLIVVTLLRWIDYLLRLGRVGETVEQVEVATLNAFRERLKEPYLGGNRLSSLQNLPPAAKPIFPTLVGYVQHINVGNLEDAAREFGREVWVVSLPGTFVDRGRALAYSTGAASDKTDGFEEVARPSFFVGKERSFDQDPRFGLSVLAEIASRALSPGINDPGTAIDVIGRGVRILSEWANGSERKDPRYPRVHVLGLEDADVFEDIFLPIARDGAPHFEVHVRLQKALAALARAGDGRLRPQSERLSALAMERSEAALKFPTDLERVRTAAAELAGRD